jgi:hypothetical protein
MGYLTAARVGVCFAIASAFVVKNSLLLWGAQSGWVLQSQGGQVAQNCCFACYALGIDTISFVLAAAACGSFVLAAAACASFVLASTACASFVLASTACASFVLAPLLALRLCWLSTGDL